MIGAPEEQIVDDHARKENREGNAIGGISYGIEYLSVLSQDGADTGKEVLVANFIDPDYEYESASDQQANSIECIRYCNTL